MKKESNKAEISSNKSNFKEHETMRENKNSLIVSFISKNVFMILLTVRSFSVYFNLIWDCDEVYNFWEPLHFVLFGNGFQTWEYSPTYSLRSYLYIYIHYLVLYPFKNLVSKITLFYILRFFFIIVCSKFESYLYHSLINLTTKKNIYNQLANFYLILTITNIGMWSSLTSFLPSTFSMYFIILGYASWMNNSKSKLSIFAIGLATLLGWPFVGILGLPIVIDILFFSKKIQKTFLQNFFLNLFFFAKITLIFALLISIPMILIDSYLFGKFVFAPWNIVKYNVFPSNPNIGPDIYGKEPLSFYLINCILNFNILFPFLFISIVLSIYDLLNFLKTEPENLVKKQIEVDLSNQQISKKLNLISLSLYLWLFVFFSRPHKEERFLYPIYPLILIVASRTLIRVKSIFEKISISENLKKIFVKLPEIVLLFHAILSIMRIVVLINNYSASLQIYIELNKPDNKFSANHLESKENINVCVSKEWYRFPSSFFLPENLDSNVKHQRWHLKFLESDFKGQLPGSFNEKLPLPLNTRYIDKNFNDENKEVFQRYISIKKCDFLIDTDNSEIDSNLQLMFNKKKTDTKWKTLAKVRFLDSANSNRLLRSFYIPYFYENKVKFTYFKLRQRIF